MDARWHRRLRLGALVILAVLAALPAAHDEGAGGADDAGPVAVSQQRGE
jgi:hypothetical protein